MADKTSIEWTDATWNPIRARNRETGRIGHFCIHASEGCRHCYAERRQPRFQNPVRFAAQDQDKVELFLDEKVLLQPLRWRKPRKVFPCSMTDMFGEWVPDEWLDRIFAVMALCPQHNFQVLTKRSGRMQKYCSNPNTPRRVARFILDEAIENPKLFLIENWPVITLGKADDPDDVISDWPLPNVWLGVSVEDQKTADARIPDLLVTPAAVRFLSCEPLLGPVDLTWIAQPNEDADGVIDALLGCNWVERPGDDYRPTRPGHEGRRMGRWVVSGSDDIIANRKIDWIICGGESGPGARPMHPDWARSLRDQCEDAGVPFLFKQWGEWVSVSEVEGAGEHFQFDDYATVRNVGKKRAGRLLDGREHNGFPA